MSHSPMPEDAYPPQWRFTSTTHGLNTLPKRELIRLLIEARRERDDLLEEKRRRFEKDCGPLMRTSKAHQQPTSL